MLECSGVNLMMMQRDTPRASRQDLIGKRTLAMSRTRITRALSGIATVLILASLGQTQTLSPVSGVSAEKEKRQVRIVTLTRWGFEPRELGANPGKVTILVRDLTGGSRAPVELRQGSKAGSILKTKEQRSDWRLTEEMQFELTEGEYHLKMADPKGRSLKIVVGGK